MKQNPILLVEDNPDDQKLALRAFKKSQFVNDIIVANDGVEALDYLLARDAYEKQSNPLPKVVFLDLKLPKKNGLDVLKEVRGNERTRYLPVVILTSSKEEEDMVSSYRLGANSYVRKPVDFNEFVDAIGHLSLYWLLLNETVPRT